MESSGQLTGTGRDNPINPGNSPSNSPHSFEKSLRKELEERSETELAKNQLNLNKLVARRVSLAVEPLDATDSNIHNSHSVAPSSDFSSHCDVKETQHAEPSVVKSSDAKEVIVNIGGKNATVSDSGDTMIITVPGRRQSMCLRKFCCGMFGWSEQVVEVEVIIETFKNVPEDVVELQITWGSSLDRMVGTPPGRMELDQRNVMYGLRTQRASRSCRFGDTFLYDMVIRYKQNNPNKVASTFETLDVVGKRINSANKTFALGSVRFDLSKVIKPAKADNGRGHELLPLEPILRPSADWPALVVRYRWRKEFCDWPETVPIVTSRTLSRGASGISRVSSSVNRKYTDGKGKKISAKDSDSNNDEVNHSHGNNFDPITTRHGVKAKLAPSPFVTLEGLSEDVTVEDVRLFFSDIGAVANVEINSVERTAMVELSSLDEATEAKYYLDGTVLLGRIIHVHFVIEHPGTIESKDRLEKLRPPKLASVVNAVTLSKSASNSGSGILSGGLHSKMTKSDQTVSKWGKVREVVTEAHDTPPTSATSFAPRSSGINRHAPTRVRSNTGDQYK